MNRRRSLPLAAAVLALLLPLGGCGSDEDDDSGPSADDTSSESTGSEPETGEAPVVEVADAGAEPRQLLELDVEEGQRTTSTITLDQTITSSGSPAAVPPISFTFDTEVVRVDDDEIEATQEYTDVSVDAAGDPSSAAAVEESLSFLDGLGGTLVLRPDGSTVSNDFELPADAPEAFASTFDQFTEQASSLTVPFPDEEVGEGASWTATTSLETGGLTVDQVTTYTLDSLDGDAYALTVAVEQTFVPGQADGFEVTDGSGSTEGTVTGDLTHLAPDESSTTGSTSLEGQSGGQEISVVTDLDLTLTSTTD